MPHPTEKSLGVATCSGNARDWMNGTARRHFLADWRAFRAQTWQVRQPHRTKKICNSAQAGITWMN